MAKKINFIATSEVVRASNALKDMHIEHVMVEYPKHENKDAKVYLIVRNRLLADAIATFTAIGVTPTRVKTQRHFESVALHHTYYQPQFDCKCRHCGKTFKSVVKEAVWCSKECKKAFRDEKRKNKTA
jgi:hypothetical protein